MKTSTLVFAGVSGVAAYYFFFRANGTETDQSDTGDGANSAINDDTLTYAGAGLAALGLLLL